MPNDQNIHAHDITQRAHKNILSNEYDNNK